MLKRTKDRESWLPSTVRFPIGGGVFPRLAEAIGKPDDPLMLLNDNARKLYDTMQKAGKEGARWTDLERAVGNSKGNVSRGLEEVNRYELMEKKNGRYFVKVTVPEQPIPATDSRSTQRSHIGTSAANGTGESGTVPPGTTPLWGGTDGTTAAGANGTSHSRRTTTSLPGPPEDGDEPRRSSPPHLEDGAVGGHDPSARTPPSLADVAEAANSATTSTENEACLSEPRQPRQPRQHPATSDEPATSPTPPMNSANGAHGRRLTDQEVELVKRLIAEGKSAAAARATVLRLDEPKESG